MCMRVMFLLMSRRKMGSLKILDTLGFLSVLLRRFSEYTFAEGESLELFALGYDMA